MLPFLILIFFFVLFYVINWIHRRRKKFQLFKRLRIPGPEPNFIDGNSNYYYYHKNLLPHEVHEEWIKKYGKTLGYFIGVQPYILVADLDTVRQICISNASTFINRPSIAIHAEPYASNLLSYRDDDWRRVRRLLSPMFSTAKVSSPKFIEMITDCAKLLCDNLNDEGANNLEFIVQIDDKLQRFSMDVISRSALGLNENWYDKNNEIFIAIRDFFDHAHNPLVDFANFFPSKMLNIIFSFITDHMTAGKMTDAMILNLKKIIKEYCENNDRDQDNSDGHQLLRSLLEYHAKGKLSQKELIANAHLIHLAGYETTACGLSFAIYLLAKYQHVQDRLREEVTREGIYCEYVERIWLETLRLYPPATEFITRNAGKTIEINGTTFEEGVNVFIPNWHIHHDAEIWPDPFTFDPDRFINRDNITPEMYSPFGIGPKICLGMKMANYEARIVLSMFVQKYRFYFCDETCDPISIRCPAGLLHPNDPIKLKFVPI